MINYFHNFFDRIDDKVCEVVNSTVKCELTDVASQLM